jgi:Flp pilus assembly protein TadG
METAKTGAQSHVPRAQRGRTGRALLGRRRGRRAQRGVVVIEYALVLPWLLLLLFGVVELGFILYDKTVITSASRAAVRQGVAFGETASGTPVYMAAQDIQSIATGGFSSMLLNFAAATPSVSVKNSLTGTVTGTTQACSAGANLTVGVTYSFNGLPLGGASFDPLRAAVKDVLTLSSSTTMSCE